MDKICEFCGGVQPMVYCHADAAYLCLSCDSKVHSANEVSNRHLRSLLCDSCRHLPAWARCTDHRMFVCKTCDDSLHAAAQHRRRPVSSYIGCPSADHFAGLWGLELSNKQQSGSSFVLNQILDLKRLQNGDKNDASAVVRERAGALSLDDRSPPRDDFGADKGEKGLGFSEGETSPFVSTMGEAFWQCKSPGPAAETWSKSLQDLDVCEYLVCHEDFDIPDVDTSFSNFEDLFKGDDC